MPGFSHFRDGGSSKIPAAQSAKKDVVPPMGGTGGPPMDSMYDRSGCDDHDMDGMDIEQEFGSVLDAGGDTHLYDESMAAGVGDYNDFSEPYGDEMVIGGGQYGGFGTEHSPYSAQDEPASQDPLEACPSGHDGGQEEAPATSGKSNGILQRMTKKNGRIATKTGPESVGPSKQTIKPPNQQTAKNSTNVVRPANNATAPNQNQWFQDPQDASFIDAGHDYDATGHFDGQILPPPAQTPTTTRNPKTTAERFQQDGMTTRERYQHETPMALIHASKNSRKKNPYPAVTPSPFAGVRPHKNGIATDPRGSRQQHVASTAAMMAPEYALKGFHDDCNGRDSHYTTMKASNCTTLSENEAAKQVGKTEIIQEKGLAPEQYTNADESHHHNDGLKGLDTEDHLESGGFEQVQAKLLDVLQQLSDAQEHNMAGIAALEDEVELCISKLLQELAQLLDVLQEYETMNDELDETIEKAS